MHLHGSLRLLQPRSDQPGGAGVDFLLLPDVSLPARRAKPGDFGAFLGIPIEDGGRILLSRTRKRGRSLLREGAACNGRESGLDLDSGQRGVGVPDVSEALQLPRAETPLSALWPGDLRRVQSLPYGVGADGEIGAGVSLVLLRSHEGV